MKIDMVEKNSLRLREVEKIFTNNSISSEIILQTFRSQDKRRMVASSRAYQYSPEKTSHQPKFNLLHVTGKELQHASEIMPKVKNRDIKGLRIAL